MSLSVCVFSILLFFMIGLSAYQISLEESQEVLDRQMQEMASFLDRNNISDRTSIYDRHRPYDETDLFIDIVPREELQKGNSRPDYLMPYAEEAHFEKIHSSRGELKVYVLPLPDKQIQISQFIKVRRHLAKQLAFTMLIPYVLFMPFAIYGFYRLIRHHLKPLDELKQTFALRDYSDLSEIHIQRLPAEITPAIDELNHLFHRIQQAQQQQKMFIANAAHELRTPLTAIRLQTSLLTKTSKDSKAYAENLQDLEQSLKRMSHLVEQLMSLAHQDVQDKQALQSVNIVDSIRRCVGQLLASAHKKHIDIQVQIQDEQAKINVAALPAPLDTILLNLMDNAIKYNPEHGAVLLKINSDLKHVYVEIHDNGDGIDPSQYEHVVQRFVRLEKTQHQAIGSGLGLSIVQTALEQIHAEMHFQPSAWLRGLQVSLKFLRWKE
ncbi:sensor histidine kinase [Acinetobacter sp. MB5]|uniref:sensor histidine kinase n=1 Tax=Acinetobacter sp. MB5 TaxID=2069438 RepID=UPI000DCFE73D|nr:ATP-binding protein [Acinetobacter sp. MB5]